MTSCRQGAGGSPAQLRLLSLQWEKGKGKPWGICTKLSRDPVPTGPAPSGLFCAEVAPVGLAGALQPGVSSLDALLHVACMSCCPAWAFMRWQQDQFPVQAVRRLAHGPSFFQHLSFHDGKA